MQNLTHMFLFLFCFFLIKGISVLKILHILVLFKINRNEKLPQKITVWRGGTSDGLSWTTDKKVAVKFANRFHDYKPEIHCRQVHKSDVICCLEDRSESEIILMSIK